MKTVQDVYNIFFELLKGSTPVFRQSYPDTQPPDEFYVINTLGVPADPIQTIEVNVNCYAKDANINSGIPDLVKLDTMTKNVIDKLHGFQVYTCNEVHIAFQRMIILREPNLNMHYNNLRFQLIYLNN